MNDYDNNINRTQDNFRPEDNRAPEEIEHDLNRTRAQMSSTIDAIQHKLTPSEMMDQALTYARSTLPADFSRNLGNAVRDNPVPAALIGIGIAWLAMSGRNSDGQARVRRRAIYDDRQFSGTSGAGNYDSAYGIDRTSATHGGSQGGKMRQAASAISEKGRDLKGRASETAHGIKEKAGELKERISGTASSMTDKLHGSADSARARAGDLTQRSQQQYYRAKNNVVNMIDEQPLLIGAVGLAIGTMLGAALPSTRREDELMGKTRDDLLDSAKETAMAQVDNVKESAQRVAQVATEEAKRVAQVATEEAQRVADEAKKQANGGAARTGGPLGMDDTTQTGSTPGPQSYH